MTDDVQVIRSVLDGDVDAFRDLVQRYERLVLSTVRNFLAADASETEDVAQEVFLAAYVHLRSFDTRRAAFSTWLLTIARNKCFNLRKRNKAETGRPLPEVADHRTPETEACQSEAFRRFDNALSSLPFEQRSAFVLSEIQGLPLAEVASIEGARLGTIKSRISRAKDKLRSHFTNTGALNG